MACKWLHKQPFYYYISKFLWDRFQGKAWLGGLTLALLRVSHPVVVRKQLELEQCGARAVGLAGHHSPSCNLMVSLGRLVLASS